MIRKAAVLLSSFAAALTVALAVASVTVSRPRGGVLMMGWEVHFARGNVVVEGVNGILTVWHYPTDWLVRIPMWVLFILFSAYPAIAFIGVPLRRWRRRRKGLCLKCGYDLTGNVSGRCPECGASL